MIKCLGYCCSIMTLKCASDSVDNTDLPCTHLVLLYEKFAVQCPIENIRTGREIHELVTVRFVPNKSIHGSLNRHWGLKWILLPFNNGTQGGGRGTHPFQSTPSLTQEYSNTC